MSDTYELDVTIDATRERIWRALTDSRELEAWFCEHADVSVPDRRFDFWGRFTPDAPGRDGGRHAITGVDPGRSLRFDWDFRGATTTAEISVTDEGRVHVLHTDVREREQGGELTLAHFWGGALADLRTYLELGRTQPRFDYSWPHHGGFELHAEYDAPRELVWEVEADRWKRSGQPITDDSRTLHHPAGAAMRVFDVRPGHGWSMRWDEPDTGLETVITYTLADAPGGRTRFTMVHSGFAAEADVQGMASGFFSGMRDLARDLYARSDERWAREAGVRVLRAPRTGPPASESVQALATVVRDRSDEDIAATVRSWGGTDRVLGLVFEGMREVITPTGRCVVGFAVGSGFGLRIEDGTALAERQIPDDAEAIVCMTEQDFLRMVVRELPAPRAIAEGRMTIDGDVTAADRLFAMLPTARGA